ncbi:MAG: hypothetical protein EA398_03070 [Deltaproteobacteria bacterium]|nr:MAG: hypothetical protein EA398_03070 [Deltaproteobacteria bacterium]
MNTTALIDQIMRQTTVLIAQLATSAGLRAPLAHMADQVFVALSREIEAQGVSRKVAADMFGLALRSYQLKVQRLAAGTAPREQPLREALLDLLRERGTATRADILAHFHQEDPALLAGLLHDIVECGFAYRTGRGDHTTFRMVDDHDRARLAADDASDTRRHIVWLTTYLHGPLGACDLAAHLGLDLDDVLDDLARLREEGLVDGPTDDDPASPWRTNRVLLPTDSRAGWEAAVLDHFQAMVAALCAKLEAGPRTDVRADEIGGSTWSFTLHDDHPCAEEARSLLRDTRQRISALRERVSAHNDAHPPPAESCRLTFYAGQNVQRPERED